MLRCSKVVLHDFTCNIIHHFESDKRHRFRFVLLLKINHVALNITINMLPNALEAKLTADKAKLNYDPLFFSRSTNKL